MTATDELLPCPFCGHTGIHMRKKTKTRTSVTGKMAYIASDDYWAPGYDAHVSDWRYGVRFYCGRCGASPYYTWGEWHIPDDDEIEMYGDVCFNISNQFDSYEDKDRIIAEARDTWNRRAEP